jgi:hypothetical protein
MPEIDCQEEVLVYGEAPTLDYLVGGAWLHYNLAAIAAGPAIRGPGSRNGFQPGPNEFELNLYEELVSQLDIDGLEYGNCVRENRLDYWQLIAGSAVPKRVVPPFRVPNPNQPLTTPASVAAHGVNRAFPQSAAARNFARGLRGTGRVVSRVATPLTIAEGLYDIGVLGYCAFAD